MKKLILLALVLVSLSAWAALVPILPQNFTTNAGPLKVGSGIVFTTNGDNTITIGATGGGTLTAAQATNIVFTNSAILLGSPAGGGSIYNNMRAATPLFTGQGLLTWNGNKQFNLWFANGTTQGSYSNAISFRAGIKSMGPLDQDNNQFIGSMDPTIYSTYITVSDNPARWDWTNRNDNTGLFIGSGLTYGSGESLNFLTVITNALTGFPIVIAIADNEVIYNQTNSRALGNTGLLPGWMGFQQNLTANSLGSYAGRVGGVGADTGNHAGWMFDMSQKRVWFPKWVDSVYVPTDVGFVGSYFDNINGDAFVYHDTTIQGNLIVESLTPDSIPYVSNPGTNLVSMTTDTSQIVIVGNPRVMHIASSALLTNVINNADSETNYLTGTSSGGSKRTGGLIKVYPTATGQGFVAHAQATANTNMFAIEDSGSTVTFGVQTNVLTLTNIANATGAALNADGTILLTSGKAAGRVLTSDANGKGTWQVATGSGGGGTNMVPVALSFSGGTNVAIVGTLPTGAVGEINYNLTLTTNAYLQVPSGTPVDGQKMIITATMDAVGTWNYMHDTNSAGGYKGGIDLALPLPITTNATFTDIIGYRYNLAKNKWLVTSHVRGY